jgi:hypothetical protein
VEEVAFIYFEQAPEISLLRRNSKGEYTKAKATEQIQERIS